MNLVVTDIFNACKNSDLQNALNFVSHNKELFFISQFPQQANVTSVFGIRKFVF